MRTRVIAIAIWLLLTCPVQAQQASDPQSIFLGQIDCGPAPSPCLYGNLVSRHSFLHVIVHDLAGNPDWQIRAGWKCDAVTTVIAGGVPIGDNGYLEQVVDLRSLTAGTQPFQGCLSFEGRNGWAVYFYAAWFDDVSSPDADVVYPGYQTMNGRPARADLDVTLIHRAPALPYDARYNEPVRGQPTTFIATIQNSGTEPAAGFDYAWSVDGRAAHAGTNVETLAPGATSTEEFTWDWQPGPHSIRFRILPLAADLSTANNELTVRTDALSLGFWVEQSALDYFSDHQYLYCSTRPCAGSDSFADWLQRQVSTWNMMAADSVYPGFAPGGVADRMRVDAVHVVPDNSLPLAGTTATDTPDERDHSVDLEWGLPWSETPGSYPLGGDRGFDVDWPLLHELGHARYLTDLYRLDVPANSTAHFDVHAANGQSIVDQGSPDDPSAPLAAFTDPRGAKFYYLDAEQDLMSCTCIHGYSAYTAEVLNRIRGRRARCGNTNAPCNIGEWFKDIPADTRLRILMPSGRPLPDGTAVRLLFDSGGGYADHSFSDADSVTRTTVDGQIDLGSDPFRSRGSALTAPQHLLLLEVRSTVDEFCFLEPPLLNEAYWRGYRDAAHPAVLTMWIGSQKQNSCDAELPGERVNDPFATDPYRSLVVEASAPKGWHRVTVRLVGDGPGREPMAVRQIVAEDERGRVVAWAATDARGLAVLTWKGRSASRVVDRTDDDLVIASVDGAAPRLRVQQR